MKFIRTNGDDQFSPSNFELGKSNNTILESYKESYRKNFNDGFNGFKPSSKRRSNDAERQGEFRMMHIEFDEVWEFEVPIKTNRDVSSNEAEFGKYPTRCMGSNMETDMLRESSMSNNVDYNEFNYESLPLKSQTMLLWSGPHWQIEKLLMDITFSQDTCVNVDESGENIVKTLLLNNGQDGSIREHSSHKFNKVIEIQYNYPDQNIDEPSNVTFSFKKTAQLYYVVIAIADFTVTLDVPINPQKFCFEYLKRVLHVGGTFTIDK